MLRSSGQLYKSHKTEWTYPTTGISSYNAYTWNVRLFNSTSNLSNVNRCFPDWQFPEKCYRKHVIRIVFFRFDIEPFDVLIVSYRPSTMTVFPCRDR